MDLAEYTLVNLLQLQAEIFSELHKRKVIRTKNTKGDIGEYITIECFNSRSDLPNLELKQAGNKDVDAISDSHQLYSIKTITSKSTSCFYGLEKPNSIVADSKKFDFLIITELNEDWSMKRMMQFSWDLFLKYKSWHSTMNGWKITLNKKMISEATILFQE